MRGESEGRNFVFAASCGAQNGKPVPIIDGVAGLMCGITGFVETSSSLNTALARDMANAIAHRGPDDAGVWADTDAGVALAHRRLSILDLSPAGHQPMLSSDGRYVIAFNGEIYNHLELRRDMEQGADIVWKGHSDTETLLAAISAWGVEKALAKSVGMFAFALWDRAERILTLARDRLGEKPLYYGLQNDVFMFGSELKALKAHPAFAGEIDRDALALYLRYNYIPAPYSIYKGIQKLLPGSYLQVSVGLDPKITTYWSASATAETGQRTWFAGSETEAKKELERLLTQSISGQMMADVPLGAFLSGGVDSSAVVALMQAQSSRPVKTFTIGFREEDYNEAEYAHAVAKHLGSEHTELYVSPEQAMAVIPLLPHIYDEPFADSSQIPTWLVSQLAREQVTVSLSGDGGDELFGGYNRYFMGQAIWNKLDRLPLPLRTAVARLMTGFSPDHWNTGMSAIRPLLPGRLRFYNPGDKLHKLAGVLRSESPENLYLGLVSLWEDPANIVIGSREPATVLTDRDQWPDLSDFTHRMMALDTLTYMPDDILVKVDRAAMNLSLETRVPFLDHRIVEFAWRLPLSMKIHQGQGKHLLRQILYDYVPEPLIDRPKMGFGIPLDSWLRGPLRGWAESLLDESRIKQEGYFNPAPIRKKWEEHLSGQRNWQYHLWGVLMFEAWLESSL
ncbi:MAG: asparagine synthase (glutamine-hydrolyzing) [Methylomonas sp.]